MKLSTRPMSSPGRLDKFPPQLMRFLRTNAASRSRGSRSRASPIFIKHRTTGSAPAVEADTKEPSSPKVTCMGQVRARRSKHGPRKGARSGRRRSRWIPGIIFCRGSKRGGRVRLPSFRRWKCCAPGWPEWGSLFRFGSRGESRKWGFGSGEEELRDRREDDAVEDDDDDGEIGGKINCLGSSPCSPPKNALILTRCRSAPYTSSSLACRFWGSPFDSEKTDPRFSAEKAEPRLSTEKTEHRPSIEKTEQRHASTEKTEHGNGRVAEGGGEQTGTDYSDVNPMDGEPRDDGEATNSEGTTSGPTEDEDDGAAKSENDERERMGEAEAARPMMLTRCKSEPARTGEKLLDPEVGGGGFWRKTRQGIVDSCSPRAL